MTVVPLLAMAGVVYLLLGFGDWAAPGVRLVKGAILAAAIGGGLLVYGGGCLLCRVPEADRVMVLLGDKLRRRKG